MVKQLEKSGIDERLATPEMHLEHAGRSQLPSHRLRLVQIQFPAYIGLGTRIREAMTAAEVATVGQLPRDGNGCA